MSTTTQQIHEHRTVVRKCSYCSMTGHNVSNCTSPALLCYLATICTKYKHLLGGISEARNPREALVIAARNLKIYLMCRTNQCLKETLCALVRNLKLILIMPTYENACYLITKYIVHRYMINIYPHHIHPHQVPSNEHELFSRTVAHYGRICQELEEYKSFELNDNIIPYISLFQVRYTSSIEQVNVFDIFSETFECPICFEFVDGIAVLTECGHKYCNYCFDKIKNQSEASGLFPKCAMCRCEIKKCKVSTIKNNQLDEPV
jgi:hypothetical protein